MVVFSFTFSISKIVKDDRDKKTPIGMPLWSKFNTPSDCIIIEGDKVFCVITGRKNNISVIDCDSIPAYENIIKLFPVLKDTYTVKTSKGYHIYVKYNQKAKTTTNAYLKIDVRSDGGMVFGAGTKTEFNTEYTIHNDTSIVDAPIEVWTYLCLRKAKSITNEPRVNLIENNYLNITPYHKSMLENVDVLYWDEYDDWIRLVWAIKNQFGEIGYELAKDLSFKSDKYDEEAFDNLWDKGSKGNSWGTIEHYSKLSNEKEHINIKLKYSDNLNNSLDFNDLSIGKCVLDLIGDEVFLKDGVWYLYEEEYEVWCRIETEDEKLKYQRYIYIIANSIYERALDISIRKLKEMDNESDEFDKEKKRKSSIATLLSKLGNVGKLSNISNAVKILLSGSKKNNIKLNNNPDLFCFDDKTIDLMTGKDYQRNKYDYISITCGYDFRKATESEYKTIDTIINQVFPNPEIRKTYASILFQCLTGNHNEKFVICNGKGRNGKGVINEQLASTLGGKNNYYYKGKISTITEKIGSGASPEIADMNNKRVAIFTEPEEHMSLYVATIKALTGDSEMTARKLYTNSSEVNLKFMMMMECNKIPKINGTIGIAEIERFIVVEFNSMFLDSVDESVINTSNIGNKHPLNKKLKDTDHQDNHKHAFFEWVMNNASKELYVAECVKEKTQSYLQSCDDIISFLNERIEYVGYDVDDADNQFYVSSKDLFELFKDSTIYLNMNKMEKRKYNYIRFKEDLRTNQKFAKHYVERCLKKGVALFKNNILLGWRMKEGNDDDDDDNDFDDEND